MSAGSVFYGFFTLPTYKPLIFYGFIHLADKSINTTYVLDVGIAIIDILCQSILFFGQIVICHLIS